MTSNVVAAVADPADVRADAKFATQDALGSDQIVQLHRELSDAAVAESAQTARIVWAQVKGFPFWPAQVLLAKEAKIKFRDTAQEYTEKRMATQRPVLFFVTKEISWVHTKQIKSWGQGMADGCHTKNRSSQKFRQALVQVGDLLLGRKSAPAGFTKPAQPAVCSMTPIASPTPKERRSNPSSPDQAAPSLSASVSKPKPKAPSAAEQFAEQQERSRNAILGGISRDERHRRRTEGRTSDSAVQSQPSQSEAPRTPASASKQALLSPKQCMLNSIATEKPVNSNAEEQAPSSCQPAATAPAAPVSADPSTAHTEPRRFSSDGVLLKRHTRSQGTAELGASDLQNLEPRKAPRRALSCAAPAATSCMGSRGTGDGATGRPPATDTPRSVGTHPPAGPFAEGQPSANSAPPIVQKVSNEASSQQPVQQAQEAAKNMTSPVPSGMEGCEPAEDCIRPNDREPSASEKLPEQAVAMANCTSAASHMPNALHDAAVVSASKPSQDIAPTPEAVDEGDTNARTEPTTAPAIQSAASADQNAPATDCVMEDATQEPPVEPPVLQEAVVQQALKPEHAVADDLNSARIEPQVEEPVPMAASPVEKESSLKSPSAQPEDRCATNGHILPQATSGTETVPSADMDADGADQACSSPEREEDAACGAQMQDNHVEPKVQVEPAEIVAHPVIKSVEPQQRNGTTEHVLQQAPSSVIDSAVEQRDDVGGDNRSTGKRPARRAAANRKSALELVRGETARGTQRETQRGSRTGEAAARSQAARKSGQGQVGSRKRPHVATVSPEVAGVSRTRARGAVGSSQGQELLPADASQLAAPVQQIPAAVQAAPPLAAAADDMRNRSLQQLTLLQARAAETGLNPEESRLQMQLTEYLRGSEAQPGSAIHAAPMKSHENAAPAPSPETIAGVANIMRAPRPCTPLEFWLPPEFYLMRHIAHHHIDVNRYPASIRPKKLRTQQISVCNCTRDPRYAHTDTYCCGEGCLNRTSHLLCDVRSCHCRGDCKNKPFNLRRLPAVEVKLTDSRGYGLVAKEPIAAGAFVVEYTGEVIPEKERWERMMSARKRGVVHFYIMELSKGLYIDAEHIGSNARFMNSSCNPNCETQKWKDASTGETRIGLFTTRAVRDGEELTYDYQFQHAGLHAAAQGFRCMCGAPNCRGTMDINPERSRDMGRRLRVKWDGDEKWYEGYVLRYNPSNGKHTVYYPVEGSNGTQETLSLDDVEFEWIEDQILPLVATLQNVSGPGGHPGLPPAAQVQGAVLQQAAAAALLPTNPATGRVVGDVAAEKTVARIEEMDSKHTVSRSISGRDSFHAVPPASIASQLAAKTSIPIQSGSSAEKVNDGLRVALPRPLPHRPLADDAAHAKDGLELLSAVAASLPERAQTPQPEANGAPAKNGTAAAPALPVFAVLAFLPPKLPGDVTLSDALPAVTVATSTTAHSVKPAQPSQLAPVSSAVGAQRPAAAAPEAVPAAVQRTPAPPQPAALPSAHAVSPDMGSQPARVLSQEPAQVPSTYSPQAAAPKLQSVHVQNQAEVRRAPQAQPPLAPDTTQLQQALAHASSNIAPGNMAPDAQQLAASMQALMQAVSQPFGATAAANAGLQQRQMLMQVAATLQNASKQNSNLLNPAQMQSIAPTRLQGQPAGSLVPGLLGGAPQAVLTERVQGSAEHQDVRLSGRVSQGQVGEAVKGSASKLDAAAPQPAAGLSSHVSAFDTLVDAAPNSSQVAATISGQATTQPLDASAVAIAQTLRAAQNAAAPAQNAATPSQTAAASGAVRDALAAVVSSAMSAGAGSGAASTQVSTSGEDLAAALHMPPLHSQNQALAAAVADADKGANAPHPLAFAQQMPHAQHHPTIPSGIPALLANARNAVTEAHAPSNQRASAPCVHGAVGRTTVAPAPSRPPAAGHFANAAVTAANAAAAGPSSESHWLVRLDVPQDAVRAWMTHAGQSLGIADPLNESHRPRFLQFLKQYMQYVQLQQQLQVQNAVQLQLGQLATHDAQGRATVVAGTAEQQQPTQQAFVQPTSL